MPRRKTTAHSELDELRQAAVAKRMKQRDLGLSLEAAKSEV